MKAIATLLAVSTLFLATPASAQSMKQPPVINTFRMFRLPGVADKLKSQGYGRPGTNIYQMDLSAVASGNKGLRILWNW